MFRGERVAQRSVSRAEPLHATEPTRPLAVDRATARNRKIDMDYKKLGFGLGVFSIALAAAELFAAKRIARLLGVEGKEGVIRAFGGRELLAGASLITAPAASANVWNRVGGDAMDMAALGLAAPNRTKNKALWGAIAFVAGAALLDVLTARGLDRTTGKTFPTRADLRDSDEPGQPTSIEPEHTAHALAPAGG